MPSKFAITRARFIEFNLDMAHWNIAEHGWIRRSDRANAIVHAHITGHHRTVHFGGNPLMEHEIHT